MPSCHDRPSEFTVRSIIIGIFLGLVFAVTNTYLGLMTGSTITAAIPAVIVSTVVLRNCFRSTSFFESNLVKTIASSGEGMTIGVIFTVPAFFLLGEEISSGYIFLLCILGGALGVLFSIPLRQYVTVKHHGAIPFSEATNHATLIKSNVSWGLSLFAMGLGVVVASVHKLSSTVIPLVKEVPWSLTACPPRGEWGVNSSSALLGAGFLMGPRFCSLLLAGGALAWQAIVPVIHFFAPQVSEIFPTHSSVNGMSSQEVWANYVRYIAAGQIAIAALWYLAATIPSTWKFLNFQALWHSMRHAPSQEGLPLRWVIIGVVVIFLILWLFPGSPINFLMLLLLGVFGLFFIVFSFISAGMTISEYNPISGMTVIVLLITAVLFVTLGWKERVYMLGALTLGAVANVAFALTDKSSHNFKTGFLLGSSPRSQQVAEIIGLFLPALAIGGTMYLLHDVYGIGSPRLSAPQGTATAVIAKGIIEGGFPVTLFSLGMFWGILMGVLRVPIFPSAVGMFLPLAVSAALLVGGLAAFVVRRQAESDTTGRGVMLASGLVAGDACTDVIIAFLTMLGLVTISDKALLPEATGLIFYVLLAVGMVWFLLKPPLRLFKQK